MRQYLWLTAAMLLIGSAASAAGGVVDRLGTLEKSVYGAPQRDKPLEHRIQALEKHTFGEARPGAVTGRLDSLEKAVHKTELMPPIAPRLDNGCEIPQTAPEFVRQPILQGHATDNTARAGVFSNPMSGYVTQPPPLIPYTPPPRLDIQQPSRTKAIVGTAARVGVSAALSVATRNGGGGALRYLKCPLCRVLTSF